MLQRLAYQFRIEPNGHQCSLLKRFCGCVRATYNHFLEQQNTRYEQYRKDLAEAHKSNSEANVDKPFISYAEMTRELAGSFKKDKPWLNECHSQALQQVLKDLYRGYANFFSGRAEHPKFKAKGIHDAFRYPQGVKLDEQNSRIWLPKIGWVRYRNSRSVIGKIKNTTVSLVCGHWYVSIQTEFQEEISVPEGLDCGIDRGVIHSATTDEGKMYDLPVTEIDRLHARIAVYQKQLKNKVKGSNNSRKLKQKITRAHHRIACIRRDFLHKTTTDICKNHAVVHVEALNVAGMTKSASGTVENPGKNVKQKSGLNRAILEQGWGEMLRQLEYKMRRKGGLLVKVNPAYTSQTCPLCGHVSQGNRISQASFVCEACGFSLNADVVGAMNIKRAGRAQLACEVNGIGRQQQEPAEATKRLLFERLTTQ